MKTIKFFIHPSVLQIADQVLASIAEEEEDEGYQGEDADSSLHDIFGIDPVERDGYQRAVDLVFPDRLIDSCEQNNDCVDMDLECHEVLDSEDEECDEVFCDCCVHQPSSSVGGSLKKCLSVVLIIMRCSCHSLFYSKLCFRDQKEKV